MPISIICKQPQERVSKCPINERCCHPPLIYPPDSIRFNYAGFPCLTTYVVRRGDHLHSNLQTAQMFVWEPQSNPRTLPVTNTWLSVRMQVGPEVPLQTAGRSQGHYCKRHWVGIPKISSCNFCRSQGWTICMGNPKRHTTLYVGRGVEHNHTHPLTEGCCQDYSTVC